MGLQLKDDNQAENKDVADTMENASANTWDMPKKAGVEDDSYTVTRPVTSTFVPENKSNSVFEMVIKIVLAFVIVGLVIFVGKFLVSKANPAPTDVTSLIGKSENEIAGTLGITFTENTTWASNMIQYSGSDLVIHSDENLGVVYINGKQTGLHINSKKYSFYGLSVGMGEYEIEKRGSYPFEGFYQHVSDGTGGRKGTTTYFYYNKSRNDCIAIVINDTNNRIAAMTYYNDFKLLMKEADTF